MYAEPTMPNTSVTPRDTSVSTNASDGVIFWRPVTGCGNSTGLFMHGSSRQSSNHAVFHAPSGFATQALR